MVRKEIEIGELLTWAYQRELSKAGTLTSWAASASPLVKWMELGTLVDASPYGFGCIPAFDDATQEPDPDAVRIARAVAALDKIDFDFLTGIHMLGDVGSDQILAHERVRAHEDGARTAFAEDGTLRRRASISVASTAKIGRPPETPLVGLIKRSWVMHQGKPAWFLIEWQKTATGKSVPVEVDGYNRKSKRPFKGAERRFVLSPDLGSFVAERIDYQVWRLSLDHLVRDLSGSLARFEPMESRAPRWPWEGDQGTPLPRIWPVVHSGPRHA